MDKRKTDFETKNFTLDVDTQDRLDEIERFRRDYAPAMRKGRSNKSQIIRDAVKMLYNFEVLQQSAIHPKDV